MIRKHDICIVGNGAVGKAAALGLAQAGLDVALLMPGSARPAASQVASDAWDVRVYALNQVARDLLTSIRVWDALDASRVSAVDAMKVEGDGGEQAGKLLFDAYSARVGALAWIVEDNNLNHALDAALKFASKIQITPGTATALDIQADHAVVTLDNGDVIQASLVVGADGGQSWVRGQCDIDISYRSYAQRAIVANFHSEKPHHGVAYQWFTQDQGIVALLPLPQQQVSLVWSAPEPFAATLLDEPADKLAHRLSTWAQPALGELKPLQPETVRAFPLSLIRPHAITAPRVALVGDAAHVVHPLAGQGMNLGFADVTALLRVLNEREQDRDCGDARVLGRYARTRKEDVLLMQLTTDSLARLFGADLQPLRLARNIGMNLVDRLPGLKRRLMAHAFGNNA
jgi:2-octaprenylphenol hydroxylase